MQSAVLAAITTSLIMNQQYYTSSSTPYQSYHRQPDPDPDPEAIRLRQEQQQQAILRAERAAKKRRLAEEKKHKLIKRYRRQLENATSPDTMEALLMIEEFCEYMQEQESQDLFLLALFRSTLTSEQIKCCVARLLEAGLISIYPLINDRKRFDYLQKTQEWQAITVKYYLQWLPTHYSTEVVCQQEVWMAVIALGKADNVMWSYAAPLLNLSNLNESFPNQIHDFYTYWLSTLQTIDEVKQLDQQIKIHFHPGLQKILHELAQVRILALTAAERVPSTHNNDTFMKDTRFIMPCFSSLTSVRTLFNRAQRHENIQQGIIDRSAEIRQTFDAARDKYVAYQAVIRNKR